MHFFGLSWPYAERHIEQNHHQINLLLITNCLGQYKNNRVLARVCLEHITLVVRNYKSLQTGGDRGQPVLSDRMVSPAGI